MRSSGESCRYGVVVDFLHLGHGAHVPRQAHGYLAPFRALQPEQVRDLEWLAGVADVELRARSHGALMDAKQAELAHERIDADLEHVRDDVPGRVGRDLHRLSAVAVVLEELRRIAFGGIGHQAGADLEQLGDTGAALRGREAHGHEVALAQCRFERIVQLLGADFTLIQIQCHQLLVNLDHLIDDLRMRRLYRGEIRLFTAGGEKAIDDLVTDRCGSGCCRCLSRCASCSRPARKPSRACSASSTERSQDIFCVRPA